MNMSMSKQEHNVNRQTDRTGHEVPRKNKVSRFNQSKKESVGRETERKGEERRIRRGEERWR